MNQNELIQNLIDIGNLMADDIQYEWASNCPEYKHAELWTKAVEMYKGNNPNWDYTETHNRAMKLFKEDT